MQKKKSKNMEHREKDKDCECKECDPSITYCGNCRHTSPHCGGPNPDPWISLSKKLLEMADIAEKNGWSTLGGPPILK